MSVNVELVNIRTTCEVSRICSSDYSRCSSIRIPAPFPEKSSKTLIRGIFVGLWGTFVQSPHNHSFKNSCLQRWYREDAIREKGLPRIARFIRVTVKDDDTGHFTLEVTIEVVFSVWVYSAHTLELRLGRPSRSPAKILSTVASSLTGPPWHWSIVF